jgi:hypothetical protein
MRCSSRVLAFSHSLFFWFFFLALPFPSLASAESIIWFSDHESLTAVETTTDQAVRVLSVPQQPKALAADSTGNVWAAFSSNLKKFAPNGALLLEIDLPRSSLRLKHPRFLSANSYNASVWVAGGHDVLLLSKDGQRLAEWRFNREIEGIAIDIDESLWVLGHKEIARLSKSGAFLRSVALDAKVPDPDFLVVDGLGGILWVVAQRKLAKYDINRLTVAPTIIELPQSVKAIDVHPVFGTLWIATDKQLLLYDRGGQAIKAVALPGNIGRVNSMRFDPKSLSLWIGGKNHLFRLNSTGQLLSTIAADKEAALLGVAGAAVLPTLAIVDPLDNSLTNNPQPRIQLNLGSTCTGIPCLLPESYFQALGLDVSLNGIPIGPYFGGPAAEPFYLPQARLPEGQNLLTARATDIFGHPSAEKTASFVIDTVPPSFVSVSPASGTTVNQPNVVISGSVDDASANVVLNDDNGNGAMGGASFSFSIVLKPGSNAFSLSANDRAGNTSHLTLMITYQPPSAAKLKINQPLPGSAVMGESVVISGTFASGPNTGISINGVIAQTFGDQFFAVVPLAPGQNTITVIATNLDGEVARQELNLTASGTTEVKVEQVTPRSSQIRTIAGTGEEGYSGDSGPAILAKIGYPDISAMAPDGSLYFLDGGAMVIRRIAPDGTITTAAGNGDNRSAGDGGPAIEASFEWLSDMVFGPDGSLYLAEGPRVRRIDPNGVIQTIAGSQSGDFGDGGPATDARFSDYLHLAVRPDGMIYVADYYNSRLRKIDTSGIVTTIAGTGEPGCDGDGGPASAAQLSGPDQLGLASNGDLYIYDYGCAAIRRIDDAGTISTVVGNGTFDDEAEIVLDRVPASDVRFGYISAMEFDSLGRLYMLDANQATIRRLNEDGFVETIAGTGVHEYGGDNGPPPEASFSYSYGMSIGADGTLYLSDTEHHRIRAFNVLLPQGEPSLLTTAFSVESTSGEISRIDIDFDGDGTIDTSVNSNNVPLQYEYPSPGMYQVKIIITDKSGKTYTVTKPIAIKDVREIDAMLRAVYQTMLDRLRTGDVDGALKTISGGVRTKYEAVFNALKPRLGTVVDQLGTLEGATIGDELAEYVLVRGQGDQAQAFLIYFIKSEDGVWRIEGM